MNSVKTFVLQAIALYLREILAPTTRQRDSCLAHYGVGHKTCDRGLRTGKA